MVRMVSNDELAARATIKANAAPKDSRDRRAWLQVATALRATHSQESARTILRTLTLPVLASDARKALDRLIAETLEIAERERAET